MRKREREIEREGRLICMKASESEKDEKIKSLERGK